MVGLPYDFIANPLGAVRLTFDKAMSSRSDAAFFDNKDWGVADLFREFLDNGGLSKVPILNPATLSWVQPNTLVRFRGMIRDMLSVEFYVGAYKDGATWKTTKFTEVSQSPIASTSNMWIWERHLLYCDTVPGLNIWTESSVGAGLNPLINSTFPPRDKRQREDALDIVDMDMQPSDHEFQDSPSAKKMRDGEFSSQASTTEGCSSRTMVPDFDRNSCPCIVKIYDSPESALKLNEVFEFVGIITFDTEIEKDESDELSNAICEDAYSKVPRLHCIVHRKLALNDFLCSSPILEPKSHVVRGIRESLLGHLTSLLGNDGLAAHFFLLHLLSRVHARVDAYAVGRLSLNLTGFNQETMSVFGNRLKLAVQNLLPFTRQIPLTVDFLNTASLAPRKNYETNRLVPGLLQLADGSHLTIDETQLQAGTLNPTGLKNATLLKNLIGLQKVAYEFTYYNMDMNADVQLLILSEGKSNLLPADLVIPFCPLSAGPFETANSESLKAWRWYLATLRSLPHAIDSGMQKVLEDDLVAARRADRSLGSEEFSRWLTMGRLMSLSFGEAALSLEHWQMVREMERLRKERIQPTT